MMNQKIIWSIYAKIDATKIFGLIFLFAWTTFGNLSIDNAIIIMIVYCR